LKPVVLFLLAVVFFAHCASAVPADELPLKWATTDAIVKLGREENKSTVVTFKCTYIGKDPATIRLFSLSCGCMSVSPSKLILKNGEMGEVNVTVDTRLVVKKESKYILLETSVPKQPIIKLGVKLEPFKL
jgi:hypothetical protein